MHGILKRTKAPKLAVVSPTEKAKNKENNKENTSNGFPKIVCSNNLNFILNTT